MEQLSLTYQSESSDSGEVNLVRQCWRRIGEGSERGGRAQFTEALARSSLFDADEPYPTRFRKAVSRVKQAVRNGYCPSDWLLIVTAIDPAAPDELFPLMGKPHRAGATASEVNHQRAA